MRTGVPIPGIMLLLSALKGTRFKFSTARKSKLTSSLPHSGQRPEKTLNFAGRFLFIAGVRSRRTLKCSHAGPSAFGKQKNGLPTLTVVIERESSPANESLEPSQPPGLITKCEETENGE